MNQDRYTILIKGKQYYIHSRCEERKDKKYIGEFSHNVDFGTSYYLTFINVKSINEKFSACCLAFCPRDTYYDVEKVRENSQKAIQTMEQRTLNMILKRLVNDEFQWP
jgi:hypothetical protein